MELDNLIERTIVNFEDVMSVKADYCSISVEDVEAIIEFLKQLSVIQKDN